MKNLSKNIPNNKLHKSESEIPVSKNTIVEDNVNIYKQEIFNGNFKKKISILGISLIILFIISYLIYYKEILNLQLYKNNLLIYSLNLIKKNKSLFYWINDTHNNIKKFLLKNIGNVILYSINKISLLKLFIIKMWFKIIFKYNLMFIWAKYLFNLFISNMKYIFKKYSRKYKIILIIQTLTCKLIDACYNTAFNYRDKVYEITIELSSDKFFFSLIAFLIFLVLLWDNIIMRNHFNDFRTNNLKIVTSTISTIITVFYLPDIKIFFFNIIGKYFDGLYSFCSKAYLKIDNKVDYEFNNEELNKFNLISKNWWRSKKIDSIFKGVEIINEIKKKSQLEVNYINLSYNLNSFSFIKKIKDKNYISKEICNLMINDYKELKIIVRVMIISLSTLTTFIILFSERKKLKLNKELRSYSKKYTFITVISGLLLPIFLNNIQQLNNYTEQGKLTSIILFLIIKLITNYVHFLSLISESVNTLKSKFNNSDSIRIPLLNKNISNTDNGDNLNEIENEKEKQKLMEIKENSSLHKERNKKTSLLLKSNTINYKLNSKQLLNSKIQKIKDINKNKIKNLNELIKTKITSTKEIKEKLLNVEIRTSDKLFILIIKYIKNIPKNIILSLLNCIYKVFIKKLFGILLYLSNKKYRGKVIGSFDHYKLDHYIKNSRLSINFIEELLKSMTLCYSNIGNPSLVRSINIPKTELIKEFENFKSVLPNNESLEKLNSINDISNLSEIETIMKPFSGISSLENKINVEIQYYMVTNSIQILSNYCQVIKLSCQAIINSESLIELVNNITNNDMEKITLLLNSKMDYTTISNILKSIILKNENKNIILAKYSLIMNSFNKVNVELVDTLNKLDNIDTKDIFVQWNILKNGLKYILNEIKNNRRSYEDIYMGGLPLHTLQMSLHHLNAMAKKTSDLVQESIISCSEFCLYFNLKTIEEIYEWNKTSTGQLELFDLCKNDCTDILKLIKTIKKILQDIFDNKLRIEGKEIDISYLSSALSPTLLNLEHKCCRKESDSNCKLHGKGLHETFKLYSEGNYPAVNEINENKNSKFIPERPRSSIPRESSNNKDTNDKKNNITNDHNETIQSHTNPKTSISNIKFDKKSIKNENLPFLLSTPEEIQNKDTKNN